MTEPMDSEFTKARKWTVMENSRLSLDMRESGRMISITDMDKKLGMTTVPTWVFTPWGRKKELATTFGPMEISTKATGLTTRSQLGMGTTRECMTGVMERVTQESGTTT